VKVYYIVNWPYHEHREMPMNRIRWIKAKVDFAGAAWYTLSRHPDATAALATWEIVRGMAALSPFRGLLLTDESDPQPLTVDTIAALSRWNVSEITRGMTVLTDVLKWVQSVEFDQHPATISRRLWKQVYAPHGHSTAKSPRRRRAASATTARLFREEIAPTLTEQDKTRQERERTEKRARETNAPPSPPSASPETANNGTESAPEASGPKAGAGQRPQPPAPATPAAPSSAQPSATAPRSPSLIYPADATPTEILCAEATGWGVSPWEPVRSGVAQLLQLSNTCRTWTPQDFTHAGLPGVTDVDGYVSAFLRDKATPDTPPNNGKLKASFRHWHFQRIQQRTKALEPPKPPERPPDDGQRVSMTEMLGARLRWREKCRAAGVNPDAPDAEQKVPFEKLMAAVEVPNSGGAHGPARRSSEPR
jgi:hypothetical protein